MKTINFEGTVTSDGKIAIPAAIARQLPLGEPLRVVLQWDGADDEDGACLTPGSTTLNAHTRLRIVFTTNYSVTRASVTSELRSA